jgi:hypothetical protein
MIEIKTIYIDEIQYQSIIKIIEQQNQQVIMLFVIHVIKMYEIKRNYQLILNIIHMVLG